MRNLLAFALLAYSAVVAGAPCSEVDLTCGKATLPTAAVACKGGKFHTDAAGVIVNGSVYTATITPGACPVVPPPPPPPPPPAATLITGTTDVTAEANLVRPTHTVAQTEPHWSTTIQAGAVLADIIPDPHGGTPSWIRNDYSRRQAFNADNTRYMVNGSTGYWYQYSTATRTLIGVLPNLAGDAEPQWDPVNPTKLFYIAINGTTRQLYSMNVDTGVQVVEGDMGPKMDQIAACQGTSVAYTKAEGSPSKDMRYWAWIGADASFQSKCLFVWDNATKTIVGSMSTGGDNPDHISMTPDGRYAVPSWDTNNAAPGAPAAKQAFSGPQTGCSHPTISTHARCDHTPTFVRAADGKLTVPANTTSGKGTRAYDVHFATYARVHHKSEHSDLGTLANGHAQYCSLDYQANAGDVFCVDIDAAPKYPAATFATVDAPRLVLFPTYFNPLDGYTGGASGSFHFSAKGFGKPGIWLIATYGDNADRNGVFQWFHKRIFLVNTNTATPTFYQVATMHSTGGGYEAETHPSMSADGTRIQFNSNWNNTTDTAIAPFQIALPAGSYQ